MTYTFDQLKDALNVCTSYDLRRHFDKDEEHEFYALIDPYGDDDGDYFEDLDDVYDYISLNDQVSDYLNDTYAQH